MISTFDLRQIFPRFILRDKNGYAMAKAIEAALNYFLAQSQEGLDTLQDVDKMPEWRLDEMAWEMNCLYDETAAVEVKREWIRNAIPLYSIWGTKASVLEYLKGYFGEIELEENWQYEGEPFHFRVTVGGEWTPKNEAWARKAIDRAKNVRSVLDGLRPGCRVIIGFTGSGEIGWRYRYPEAGELTAGEWPDESHPLLIDESGQIGATGESESLTIEYPMTGVYPEINTEVVIDEGGNGGLPSEDIVTPIYYPMCGEGYSGEET